MIAWLNLQLTDLASRLLLANNLVKDEAGIKQSLCRTAQEQEEEMKRLNLQLSSQSSQLLANTVKEETLLNLQEATLKQEEECAKLNQKLGQLSLLLETTTETKEKAELSATKRLSKNCMGELTVQITSDELRTTLLNRTSSARRKRSPPH